MKGRELESGSPYLPTDNVRRRRAGEWSLNIRRRFWKPGLLALSLLVGLGAAGFVWWSSTPAPAMAEAMAALEPDASVRVTVGQWLVFEPALESPRAGLVFYPGGRVDPRAYAPAMHALAERGFLAVIVPMPLNLAVIDPGAAADVLAAYPTVPHWAVGGHSLGGAMAAHFAGQNRGRIDGLVLWAAYPARNDDLSAVELAVLSISATSDGLATPEKIAASRALLPQTTRWVTIAGGNHAQFGWYGMQTGDDPAAISREEQQGQVIEATLQVLETIAGREP